MNSSVKMVNGNKRVKIYIALTLVLTFASVVLHTFGWVNGYDTDMGEYSTLSKIGYAASWLTFGSAVILLTSVFTVKKDLSLNYGYSAQPDITESYVGAISGGLIGAFSIITFLNSVRIIKEIIGVVNNGYGTNANLFNYSKLLNNMCRNRIVENSYLTRNLFAWLGVLMLPFGLAFCGYMLISAIYRKDMRKQLSVLGFFPVIWGIICLVRLYFDSSTALNDPIKIFLQMCVSSLIIFFLAELRSRVGRYQSAYYVAAASIGSLLGITCPMSLILARFHGVNLVNCDMMLLFTLLGMGAFVLTRLLFVNKKRRVTVNIEQKTDGTENEQTRL